MKKNLLHCLILGLTLLAVSGCANNNTLKENTTEQITTEEITTEEITTEEITTEEITTEEITTEEITTEEITTEEITTEEVDLYSCPMLDEIKNGQPFEYSASYAQIADMLFTRNMTFSEVMQVLENSKFNWVYIDDGNRILSENSVLRTTVTLDGKEMFVIEYSTEKDSGAMQLKNCYFSGAYIIQNSSCPYYLSYIPGGIGNSGENMPDYFSFIDLLKSYGITNEKQGNDNFSDSYNTYDMWYEESSSDDGNLKISVYYNVYKSDGPPEEYRKNFIFSSSTGKCIYTLWDQESFLIKGISPNN